MPIGVYPRSDVCRLGHPLTYLSPDGKRGCLDCRRRQAREAHARAKVRRLAAPVPPRNCARCAAPFTARHRGKTFCDDPECQRMRKVEATRRGRAADPERVKRHRETQRLRRRHLYATDPEYREKWKRARRHWLSVVKDGKVTSTRIAFGEDEYRAMLAAQGGLCAVCGKPETAVSRGTPKSLAIDHDHAKGHVRGLLCSRCNTGLGLFDDDVELLAKAIAYLARPDDAIKRDAVERLGRAVAS